MARLISAAGGWSVTGDKLKRIKPGFSREVKMVSTRHGGMNNQLVSGSGSPSHRGKTWKNDL